MGILYAELDKLKEKMDKTMKNIDPNVREKLYLLMSYEGASLIS